jgi:hypothetical protein
MYQINEIILKNKQIERKRFVIEFIDPAQAIVGEFLMTDSSLLNYSVLDDLNKVLSEKSDYIEFSGNRCSLEIRSDKTLIEDLFEGMFANFDTLPAYKIETKTLRDLVVMWKEKLEELNESFK